MNQRLAAILSGGAIAATIDVGAACLINLRSPNYILHVIAGGLLAKASLTGGVPTAVLGLVLQELMGLIIAAIYVGASVIWPSLLRRWAAFGALYGVAIFVVMNFVVVPLSAWKVFPAFSPWTLVANVAAMELFGLIIAYYAHQRLSEVGSRPASASS